MADKEIVFKIEAVTNQNVIDAYGEVLDKVIGKYDDWIEETKKQDAVIKDLNARMREKGDLTNEELKQLNEAKSKRSQYQQLMKQEDKINTSVNGSLKQQQLILSKVNTALRNMTDEQKKANPELVKFQKNLYDSVKGMNAEMGNFQMNVGNYPQLLQQISSQVPGLNNVAGAFSGILNAATPIGGAIAAIGLAVKGVTMAMEAYNEAIDGSQRLTWQLNEAMSSLDASNDAITRSLQNNADGFIQLKGNVSAFWGWVKQYSVAAFDSIVDQFYAPNKMQDLAEGNFGEFFRKMVLPVNFGMNLYEQAQDYKAVKDLIAQILPKQQELEKLKENSVVRLAELNRDAEEQLLITRQKDQYTAEQRLAAAQKYKELISERTGILKAQAILERDILILEGERTDNTHEVNMAIEQGKAKLIELERQELSALRTVERVRQATINELSGRNKPIDIDASKVVDVKSIKAPAKMGINALIEEFKAEANEAVAGADDLKQVGTSAFARLIGVNDAELEAIKSKAEQAAQQIYGSIQQIAEQRTQQRLDQELRAIDSAAESEKAILKSKLDKNLISQEQYEHKLAAIEEEAEEKREQANKDTFAKNKIWNLAQAAMNMALAITNIWATNKGGMASRIAETAIASAAGVAQIATIAAQKYARGGELHGASHAQGGIKGNIQGHNIELEGDEVVINKRSAHKYRNILSYINSDNGWGVDFAGVRGSGGYSPNFRFARGGVLSSFDFSPSATPQSSSVQQAISRQANRVEELIYAINRRIDRLQVMVNISDIEDASNTKQVHINRASLWYGQ
jgi:hypothetical protein